MKARINTYAYVTLCVIGMFFVFCMQGCNQSEQNKEIVVSATSTGANTFAIDELHNYLSDKIYVVDGVLNHKASGKEIEIPVYLQEVSGKYEALEGKRLLMYVSGKIKDEKATVSPEQTMKMCMFSEDGREEYTVIASLYWDEEQTSDKNEESSGLIGLCWTGEYDYNASQMGCVLEYFHDTDYEDGVLPKYGIQRGVAYGFEERIEGNSIKQADMWCTYRKETLTGAEENAELCFEYIYIPSGKGYTTEFGDSGVEIITDAPWEKVSVYVTGWR